MTLSDKIRLAQIRAQYTIWESNPPEGYERWESPFLLKVIDDLVASKSKRA